MGLCVNVWTILVSISMLAKSSNELYFILPFHILLMDAKGLFSCFTQRTLVMSTAKNRF